MKFTEAVERELKLYQGRVVLVGLNPEGVVERIVWSFPPHETFGIYQRFKAAGLDSGDYVSHFVPLELEYDDLDLF